MICVGHRVICIDVVFLFARAYFANLAQLIRVLRPAHRMKPFDCGWPCAKRFSASMFGLAALAGG